MESDKRMEIRELINKVKNTISRYDMVDRGDRVIVAVSGGPDSVCLLDILYAIREDLGIDVIVAHYDHGLRPEDDASETAFVRQLALSMSLPFVAFLLMPVVPAYGFVLRRKGHDHALFMTLGLVFHLWLITFCGGGAIVHRIRRKERVWTDSSRSNI